MLKRASTDQVPQPEQIRFWTEIASNTFVNLDVKPSQGRSFIEARLASWEISTLNVSILSGSAQTVHRTLDSIAYSSSDYYLLGVQTQGSCRVVQDGRVSVMQNGAYTLWDTARPYSLDLSDNFGQIILRLPRRSLERHLTDTEHITAVSVNATRGASMLLANTLLTLAQESEVLEPAAAQSVAKGVEHLVVAGLSEISAPLPDRQAREHAARRSLVQNYILDNLADESLSISTISVALHLSPSSIHRAFAAANETVMNWVWSKRLERIRQALMSGRFTGTLMDLSQAWGFSSQAHFSRAYRQRYGSSPSQTLNSCKRISA